MSKQYEQWTVEEGKVGYIITTPNRVVVEARDEHGRYGAIHNKQDAQLIAAAPETAAERDRLRSLNAELVTEIQNSLIEHQSVLGFLHERAAEGESVRIWIEMTEHRIAGCQAAIAKATAPAQPIPANTKEQV